MEWNDSKGFLDVHVHRLHVSLTEHACVCVCV